MATTRQAVADSKGLAGPRTALNMTMLIERGEFLAALLGLLREAAAGQGRLVFLGGEAGVGKTTLTAALAGAAGDGPAGLGRPRRRRWRSGGGTATT